MPFIDNPVDPIARVVFDAAVANGPRSCARVLRPHERHLYMLRITFADGSVWSRDEILQ